MNEQIGHPYRRDGKQVIQRRTSSQNNQQPSNPHRVGHSSGLHPVDQPYVSEDLEEDDRYYETRPPTSTRRYIGKKIEDWTVIEKAINLLRGEDKNQPDLKTIDHSIDITKASQEQLVLDLKQLDREGYPKLKGRARQLVLNDLEESEKQLSGLMNERLKVLAGQGDWQKKQEDIDKFLKWCLTARDTYQNATYEEKRRALRVLGIVVYVYREDDESKDRYEIRVRVPDIVRHTS